MDIRKIGIVLILVGIVISVVFINDNTLLVPALTVTVLGFFITVVGFVEEVKKRKIINDKLDDDIGNIIQPLVTKYSNLNKQYLADCDGEEYYKKRLELNKNLEQELSEKIDYLEPREIKKIVIQFSKEQDKLN